MVVELALGSIKGRTRVLSLLAHLSPSPGLAHDEALTLVEQRRLWGRGLSAVDVLRGLIAADSALLPFLVTHSSATLRTSTEAVVENQDAHDTMVDYFFSDGPSINGVIFALADAFYEAAVDQQVEA